jgi:hypothetical protein
MVTSAINHWCDLCLWVATQEAAHDYCCKRDASSRTAGAFSPNFAPAVTSRFQPKLDFTAFGLAGAELIEGRVVRDGIVEVQRLYVAVASTRLAQLSAR